MRDWLDSIEARTRAQAKYDKEHTAGVYMKLNTRTDSDIIRWLWKQPSKQGAIKRLIREEIARESAEGDRSGFRQSPKPPEDTCDCRYHIKSAPENRC